MSIINSLIFDNTEEISYDASLVEVVASIDDTSSYNPFSFSGIIGNFTPISGAPSYSLSGEIIEFDFGSPRKIKSITIQQDPADYAVSYQLLASNDNFVSDTKVLTTVTASTNSGDIYHLFSNTIESRYLELVVFEVSEGNTSYIIYDVSGEANPPFSETFIPRVDVDSLTATSNVEPVDNIYDSNDTTFWQSNNSLPQEILFKFKAIKNLSKFAYVAEDNTTYPTAYTLLTSLDGNSYSQILTSGSISATSGSVDLVPTQSANYLKVRFTGSASNKLRVRDISLYEKSFPQIDVDQIKLKKIISDSMSSITLLPSTQSGSASASNLIAGIAGDWVTASSMVSVSGAIVPQYAGYENLILSFAKKTTVDSIVMVGYVDGMPVDFEIQGANEDGIYNTLRTFIGNSQSTIIVNFDDTEHNEYLFYRIAFTKSSSPYIRLREINFNIRSYATQSTVVLQEVVIDKLKNVDVTVSDVDLINRDIKYMLQIDNRNFWFAGQQFVQSDGSFNQANSLIDLNANIGYLTLNQNSRVAIVAILSSNGIGTPILESASMTSQNLANPAFEAKGQIRIRGYIAGHVGKPLEMTISLKRPINVDGQIIAYTANIIKSDNQGYFDFMLPVTELATPAKEKFAIVVQPLNYRVERYTPNQSNIDLALWLGGTF